MESVNTEKAKTNSVSVIQQTPPSGSVINLQQPSSLRKLKIGRCKRCGDLRSKVHGPRAFHSSKFFVKNLPKLKRMSCVFCGLVREAVYQIVPEAFDDNCSEVLLKYNYGGYVLLIVHTSGLNVLLEVFNPPGQSSPWKHILTAEVTSGDTSFQSSLRQAQEWLHSCRETHNMCNRSTSPALPRRVIDVRPFSSKDSIRLLETQNQRGNYLCLSHCWGQTVVPLMTTSKTISKWKDEIPWKLIPKTFQDAIAFVRLLGERYIWIDSLCIIQDDSEDWLTESAKMADVYHGSYLTLAATKSKNSHGGCFSRQDPRCNQRTFCGKDQNGLDFSVYCRKKLPHWTDAGTEIGPYFDYEQHFPLLSRAWVYQERLLSPRVLHFGGEELLWECMKEFHCECGKHVHSTHPTKVKHAATLSPGSKDNWGSTPHDRWWEIVAEYSVLKLTKLSDRLPALSGMAKQIQSLSGDQYIAGLWKEKFNTDLQWLCPCSMKVRKPRECHAPTWSWACMGCKVVHANAPRTPGMPPIFKIHDVSIKYYGNSVYGGVQSSAVTLGGLVFCATLKYYLQHSFQARYTGYKGVTHAGGGVRYNLIIQKTEEEIEFGFPDYELDANGEGHVPDGEILYCMLLSEWGKSKPHTGEWLVLHCVDRSTFTFERVGLTEGQLPNNGYDNSINYGETLFESCEEMVVTII
ncbi:HET-domain-containing protein [Stipitochalara longipes BDJ]|nr:HET-domain-containing protein [Stipitochalara longipes BDJ]